MESEARYEAGHPPHDVVAGLRVGGVTGAAVGALLMWLFGLGSFWFLVVTSTIGALLGYLSERRHLRR